MKRTREPSSCLSKNTIYSSALRRVAWVNIAVQAIFPLAVAFTPIAVDAEQHLVKQGIPLSAMRVKPYTLKTDETVTSVAQKYNLTLDQLRSINQFRTFALGFDNLHTGDELDVPAVPLPEVHWEEAVSAKTANEQNDTELTQKMAEYASQAGSFLSSGSNSDAAASMARGIVTGEAGGTLQQWLSRFGTARVQLDADERFSLKNSQFDLLLPLYDKHDSLVFTQGSLHRTDSRTQTNLGAGLRHFTPKYMLGGNIFGDYDLSRNHARMGLGLEYWRDFIKLNANGYMRLTSWKDSPDLNDYQERPADGWDIRAEAWLPSLPQLGGKLKYEQYYGKEVALFGVDNRQKNPHAITIGVNYTPVPLFTVGAEQRQGQSGQNDTRLTVDMNYQLGVPWRSQIDPTAVASMRSLIGSRYDLVDRNNNIVLEYRKKEILRLHTADLISGKPGEQKSLRVSVTSTYGLSRIDWDASALNAAGGKIVQNGADYSVVLPAYQTGEHAVNTYTISGVAIDTKGNYSDRSTTQVTVQSPEVNKQFSSFTPKNSLLPADGKSTQILTLVLRDENNLPVDIDVRDINLRTNTLKTAKVTGFSKKSIGIYTVTVTSGTDVEEITLTPLVNGITLTPAIVTINNITPDTAKSEFSAEPETIIANNKATSTLKLVVKDAQGNPLSGLKQDLIFTLKDSNGKAPTHGVVNISAIAESSTAGIYTATLKGSIAEQYTIVPEYKGSALGNLSATVTLIADNAIQENSTITTDKTSYVSGTDMNVTVTLKDTTGNAVTGAVTSLTEDTVKVANAILKSGSYWKENGDGTYTAIYTAVAVGDGLKATVRLSGWNNAAESMVYSIVADKPDQNNSAITVDKTSYMSGDDMTVTVTLKDSNDNSLAGEVGLLTTEAVAVPNASQKPGSGWKDNGDGTYTAIYSANTAGTDLKATLRMSGWSSANESKPYTIALKTEAPLSINTHVDAFTFKVGSEEGTFPTTGFTGATFTLVPRDNKRVTDYKWNSNASWVSVNDGIVKFTGTGTRDKVIITGTPVNGQGKIIKYSFRLNNWFIVNDGKMTWTEANAYCTSLSGYTQSSVAQLTEHANYNPTQVRKEGALWNEWGNLAAYPGSGFINYFLWTSDVTGRSSHHMVNPNNGAIVGSTVNNPQVGICTKKL